MNKRTVVDEKAGRGPGAPLWARTVMVRTTPPMLADLATIARALGGAREGRRRGRAELIRAGLAELARRLRAEGAAVPPQCTGAL